ncbi:hypothetical protein L914_20742 [Phytophthora nicotianae]|uniref:Uncharacterized protein n=1 Tax=Phytophthora nicotianae TaxID=4792 RepID=W2M5T9_PHYNI|nr:hypothetical protein L914_20742 [Phytophthora nicotianae]
MRDEETDRLQTLANAILNKRYISAEGICFMSKGQKFTSDPRLALIYYYCFGGHPEAFVFNDEHLREDESVKERLLNALDSPIGVEEYERCQQRSTQRKAVLSRAPPAVNFSSALTVLTSANHCCVYQIHFEYLKMSLQPDLVKDKDRIQLCSKCAFNPRESKFSLANGHEYGRYGSLSELSAVAKKTAFPPCVVLDWNFLYLENIALGIPFASCRLDLKHVPKYFQLPMLSADLELHLLDHPKLGEHESRYFDDYMNYPVLAFSRGYLF